jgi:SAM-dependent methyltransferase
MIARTRHYIPLIAFMLPTLVIGYGFVIPKSCIHGVNALSIGFGTTVLGAALTYAAGVRSASRTSCPARAPWKRRVERYVNEQAANPHGLVGWMLARLWMLEHQKVNQATIDLMQIESTHSVLELGCGPGWALRSASMKTTAGSVLGLDVSSTSLSVASRTNRHGIRAGRVALRQVDGAELELEPGRFDRAFSVHSIYFWKDAAQVIEQLSDALRSGGQLVLVFRPDGPNIPPRFRDPVYRFYAPPEVEKMLVAAGLRDVRVIRRPDVGADLVWVCATKG